MVKPKSSQKKENKKRKEAEKAAAADIVPLDQESNQLLTYSANTYAAAGNERMMIHGNGPSMFESRVPTVPLNPPRRDRSTRSTKNRGDDDASSTGAAGWRTPVGEDSESEYVRSPQPKGGEVGAKSGFEDVLAAAVAASGKKGKKGVLK